MKSIIMYLLIAFAVLAGGLPFEEADTADLVVVRMLAVSEDAYGRVTLCGPDGLRGEGGDFAAAVESLAAHAPGTLFLGACEHLVLTGSSADCLADCAAGGGLRPAVRVYFTDMEQSELARQLETLTEYLSAHPGDVRLSDVRAALYEGTRLDIPRLQGEEGAYETV